MLTWASLFWSRANGSPTGRGPMSSAAASAKPAAPKVGSGSRPTGSAPVTSRGGSRRWPRSSLTLSPRWWRWTPKGRGPSVATPAQPDVRPSTSLTSGPCGRTPSSGMRSRSSRSRLIGRRCRPWESLRTAAMLARQAADLIAELTLLGAGCRGLSAVGAETLAARLPLYGQWCRDLAGTGIPFTVQHDDLHWNNVCLAGPSKDPMSDPAVDLLPAVPEARTRVIDRGDAAHRAPVRRPTGPTSTRCLSGAVHDVGTAF